MPPNSFGGGMVGDLEPHTQAPRKPEGTDNLYDHIDPNEVKVGYLKHIPKLL